MDIDMGTVIVLYGLRKQRNLNDYQGDPISPVVLASFIKEAGKLFAHTECWLHVTRPQFLRGVVD